MQTDMNDLAVGITACFVMPIACYLLGLVCLWNTSTLNLERSWRMCCLGMPIVFLGLFLAIEFDVVMGVWRQSPVFAVIIYSIVGILVPCALIGGMIRLWRTSQRTD
jgi:hypothetical protein